MKRIKKGHAIILLALVVVATVFQSFTHIETTVNKTEITGVNLFKAIYFNAGVLRNKLNVISDVAKNDEINKKETLLIDKLVSQIEVSNPLFFEDFKNNIGTGNMIKIRESLQEGCQVLLASQRIKIKDDHFQLSLNSKNIENPGSKGVCTPYPDVWGVVVLWVDQSLPDGIIVNIAPAMIIGEQNNIAGRILKKNTLFNDQLSIEIAETFSR